ncbi:MAG TPA: hypothetical protein VD884_00900 [Ohtaekwangia sp.]|nr:hypothetical protein [Ohtaekwangia sp.]
MNRCWVLLLVLVVTCIQVFAQTKACDTVYQTVDNNPAYHGGTSALMDYTGKHLTPIISKYDDKDEESSAKLTIMLTIDTHGRVVDAVLSKHHLPKDCEDEIKRELLSMTGWTAGSLNGEKVCSKFAWIISCIKWG